MKLWRGPQGQNKNSGRDSGGGRADAEPPFDAADTGAPPRAGARAQPRAEEPPLGISAGDEDEEPVPPPRRRYKRAEEDKAAEADFTADADMSAGIDAAAAPAPAPDEGDAYDARDGAPYPQARRKRRRAPWILRALAGLGAACGWLARLTWKYARRNIMLAAGAALFGAIFLMVLYNAFFHQKTVSRPVLFSTRADGAAQSGGTYVEKVISTEALEREPQAAPDIVGDFINQKVKDFDSAQEQREQAQGEANITDMIARADAPAPAARERQAVKPSPDDRLLPTRERVLKLQKALQKSGERGLDANGVWNEKTRSALRHFQKTHGLKATGEIDGAVIAKMEHMRIW